MSLDSLKRRFLSSATRSALRPPAVTSVPIQGPPDGGLKGRKNIYVCGECAGHVVTVDADAGVTPFMIACKATTGCKGTMRSSMYRVFDQDMAAAFEWYRPDPAERVLLSPGAAEHVRNGGLLLRPIEVSP